MTSRLSPLALLFLSSFAFAEIYKCVAPDGGVTFSNSPFCEHQQAYARNRHVPLLTVEPRDLADVPAGKIIETPNRKMKLADLLERVGEFAGLAIEPMALEGLTADLDQVSYSWLALFNELVEKHGLDYRQAYDRLYVYQRGTMGETIVHSPELLRWYQADDTWNEVIRYDDILIRMKAYEKSTLQERLRRLVKLVREELGEEEAVNAAETVALKRNYTGGVGSGIVADNSEQDLRRAADEKARRITTRRQAN